MVEYWWYWLLAAVRLVLVIVPQTGYIHPDELFQTTEVIAGDILETEVYRAWEFYSSNPIRSIVLPYAVLGMPFKVQKWISSHCSIFPDAYLSLVLPRILTALLSFVTDFTVFKLCSFLHIDAGKPLMLLSSSYVMLTFLTRTFTNSYETYFFSLLIYLVYAEHENYKRQAVNSLEDSTESKKKVTKQCKNNSTNGKNRKENILLESHIEHSSTVISVGIGFIVVLGTFNRPTFMTFAVVPVSVWFCMCFMMRKLTRSIIITGITAITTFITCLILDTLYFNSDKTSGIFLHLETCLVQKPPDSLSCVYEVLQEYLVVTPWNFLRYNVRTDNLAEHGIHPRYLHFTANLFILYGPAYLLFFMLSARTCFNFLRYRTHFMDIISVGMVIFPVFSLSLFPHQEPRFLIPVLPLVIILSTKFSTETGFWQLHMLTHLIFNIPLLALFGFLHQGGIIPCLQHIQSGLQAEKFTPQDKFIFYHTYMPPRHLIHSKNSEHHIIDLQGKRIKELKNYFNLKVPKSENSTGSISERFYLVLPGTLVDEAVEELSDDFSVSFYEKFCCHLSMEDPPEIVNLVSKLLVEFSLISIFDIYSIFLNQTSLHMLLIK